MVWVSCEARWDRVGIRTRDGDEEVHREGIGSASRSAGRRRGRWRWRGSIEHLEDRALLSSPGSDYTLSGLRWADPGRITYSIAPDGVLWDHGPNVLNATLADRLGADWPRQFARALASWEAVANLNIAEVPDGPFDQGVFGQSQGDSRFGDIRLGGYRFPGDTSTLALTYMPPPNGSTAAGDIEVNTALDFRLGGDYDLDSVLLHEVGHSLGLEHAHDPANVMDPLYRGVRDGLGPGDIAGIQAIYGPRIADAFLAAGQGESLATAVDLSGGLVASASLTVADLSLAAIGDFEFFAVAAPSWGGSVLRVTATAGGLSLLSPKVELYNSSHELLAQAADPTAWGNTVTVSFPGVVPGQTYTIVVTGATGDVFDVGAYQLGVDFPEAAVPLPPSPAAPLPDGSAVPLALPPPNDSMASATALGPIAPGTVVDLTMDSSRGVAWFKFLAVRSGPYQVRASGAVVSIFNARGKRVARGSDSVNFRIPRRNSTGFVEVSLPDGSPLAHQTVRLALQKVTHAVVHPGHLARPATASARRPRSGSLPHPRVAPASFRMLSRRHASLAAASPPLARPHR